MALSSATIQGDEAKKLQTELSKRSTDVSNSAIHTEPVYDELILRNKPWISVVLTSQTDRKSEDDANSMNSSNKHVSIKEDHLWVVAAVVMVHRWRSRRRLSNQQLASTVHGCRAYVDI